MSDTAPRSSAVATAEPPAPPSGPPKTATAAAPGPRKRRTWLIVVVSLVIALLVIGGLSWLVRWQLSPRPSDKAAAAASAISFDSAMRKAGVYAPPPPQTPVELTTVVPTGTHQFDATFTYNELSALFNAFPHQVAEGGTTISLSGVSLSPTPDGGMKLTGRVSAGGNTYSGTAFGKVVYENEQVVSPAPLTVQAEGIQLGGGQAQQATQLLLGYANVYLEVVPGLKIASATITPDGVHVTGSAPDSITWP